MVASKSLLRRVTAALGALDIADGPMSRSTLPGGCEKRQKIWRRPR